MEIGLACFGVPEFQTILDFAKETERRGYESFWVPHILARNHIWFDTYETLSAVAACTKKIKLGTAVAVPPQYHPIDFARRAVTIDHISKGRLILGVGMGWNTFEYENLGIPFKERLGRFLESMKIMKKLWTEDDITYDGKYYKISDKLSLYPKPVQKPYPKLIQGGGYIPPWETGHAPGERGLIESVLKRAAQEYDGWMITGSGWDLQVLREAFEKMRKYAKEVGRELSPKNFEIIIPTWGRITIDSDRDRAMKKAEELYNVFLGRKISPDFYEVTGGVGFEQMKKTGAFGPPTEVAKKIQEFIDYSKAVPCIKRLVIQFGAIDQMEQLERFDTQVRPLLKNVG